MDSGVWKNGRRKMRFDPSSNPPKSDRSFLLKKQGCCVNENSWVRENVNAMFNNIRPQNLRPHAPLPFLKRKGVRFAVRDGSKKLNKKKRIKLQ